MAECNVIFLVAALYTYRKFFTFHLYQSALLETLLYCMYKHCYLF